MSKRKRRPRARRGAPFIRLKPFVSAGEPIVRADGTVEVVPMQLFRAPSGLVVLRIGDSTYWFADGDYDGSEHRMTAVGQRGRAEMHAALSAAESNQGHAPAYPYFQPGSDGYSSEIAGWPESERPDDEDDDPGEMFVRFIDPGGEPS